MIDEFDQVPKPIMAVLNATAKHVPCFVPTIRAILKLFKLL